MVAPSTPADLAVAASEVFGVVDACAGLTDGRGEEKVGSGSDLQLSRGCFDSEARVSVSEHCCCCCGWPRAGPTAAIAGAGVGSGRILRSCSLSPGVAVFLGFSGDKREGGGELSLQAARRS